MYGGVYKNNSINRPWNGHRGRGTDKEKLQVAVFSTKLFTEESFIDFFFFLHFSPPNEGTR